MSREEGQTQQNQPQSAKQNIGDKFLTEKREIWYTYTKTGNERISCGMRTKQRRHKSNEDNMTSIKVQLSINQVYFVVHLAPPPLSNTSDTSDAFDI